MLRFSIQKFNKKCYAKSYGKHMVNKKLLWKTRKSSLSNKVVARERSSLFENCKAIKTDIETAEDLNRFFKNLSITFRVKIILNPILFSEHLFQTVNRQNVKKQRHPFF